MVPVAVLLAVALAAGPALTAMALVVGVLAGLVQVLGLLRWTYAVPELARRWVWSAHSARRVRAAFVAFRGDPVLRAHGAEVDHRKDFWR
jgi:hypothetical protein